MWTMSNSRADWSSVALWYCVCAFGMACASQQPAVQVPNAPRPARDVSALEPPRQPSAESLQVQPVELRSVTLRRVRSDTLLTRLAGPALLQRSPDAIAIDVLTQAPLGNLNRNASPEIYVDGARLGDTWPLPPNRLVVFVADPQRLRQGMAITVAWLGDEERTRSRQPIIITQAMLQGVR